MPSAEASLTCSTLGSYSPDASEGSSVEAYCPAAPPKCQDASTTPTPARSPVQLALADGAAVATTAAVPEATRAVTVAAMTTRFMQSNFDVVQTGTCCPTANRISRESSNRNSCRCVPFCGYWRAGRLRRRPRAASEAGDLSRRWTAVQADV